MPIHFIFFILLFILHSNLKYLAWTRQTRTNAYFYVNSVYMSVFLSVCLSVFLSPSLSFFLFLFRIKMKSSQMKLSLICDAAYTRSTSRRLFSILIRQSNSCTATWNEKLAKGKLPSKVLQLKLNVMFSKVLFFFENENSSQRLMSYF